MRINQMGIWFWFCFKHFTSFMLFAVALQTNSLIRAWEMWQQNRKNEYSTNVRAFNLSNYCCVEKKRRQRRKHFAVIYFIYAFFCDFIFFFVCACFCSFFTCLKSHNLVASRMLSLPKYCCWHVSVLIRAGIHSPPHDQRTVKWSELHLKWLILLALSMRKVSPIDIWRLFS